jgi:hypothetical protein
MQIIGISISRATEFTEFFNNADHSLGIKRAILLEVFSGLQRFLITESAGYHFEVV